LQGGFKKWKDAGLQVASGPSSPAAPGRFIVKEFRRHLVKSMDEMRDNIASKQYQVVDARPERRFTALDPEPRPQLLGGHIPGSKSLEFGKVIDRPKADFLDEQALKQVWQQAQTDLSKPVVATCGSGVSASVLALSAHVLGNHDVAVYDGSWSEWGLPENNNPIAK
jgi:thiosulfate/3-mercaptopyruvate sulfurtransferase